jgi:hypothetical protein
MSGRVLHLDSGWQRTLAVLVYAALAGVNTFMLTVAFLMAVEGVRP